MKFKFLAAAILSSAIVGLAQAEYIIIIANVGLSKEADPNAANPDPNVQPPPLGGRVGGGVRPGGGPVGAQPQPAKPGDGKNDSTLLVTAVLEVKGVKEVPLEPTNPNGKKVYFIQHQWGTSVFEPTENIKLIRWMSPDNQPMPSLAARHQAKQIALQRIAKPTVERILEDAEWALSHGLLKECAELMKKAGEIDKDHPVVTSFRQVEADLARPIEKEDAAGMWQKKLLENYQVVRSAHYALLHNAPGNDNPAVKLRLERLEDSFRGFYYWFALKRKRLPMPSQRLAAVLVTRPEDFAHQHRIFDSPALVADGFFALRENLAVFSASSRDVGYEALRDGSKELWNSFNQDQLLTGKFKPPAFANQQEFEAWQQKFFEASTKALFLRALAIDSARATITHDGTRQLMAGAGLLPRNVAAPEWTQFGMGSFFEVAKGSPWGGVGLPSPTFNDNYNYLLQFKKMLSQDRKLNKVTLLEGVVTDRFFREALNTKDGHIELRARTTAWGLTFFLAHRRLDDLLTYYKEIAKLPRDLEFDDEVLLDCFARSFRLVDDKGKRSPGKFAAFASEWSDYVNLADMEADAMLKQIQKNQGELRGNP